MSVPTYTFFLWFYFGLSGIGGLFIFTLLSFVAVIWLFHDSIRRRLPVMGWKLGIAFAAILILPAILYRFTITGITDIATSPLEPFSEPIFYLGVLGGVLPLVLAIGYYVTFQGLVACPDGHIYEARLGNCPHPDHLPPPQPSQNLRYSEPRLHDDSVDETSPPARPSKKRLNAWLINTERGRNYQLYVNETRIGRSIKNDIVLEGDRTVSRESARIIEQNGRFRLYSLNSGRYPRVNNYVLHEPMLLETEDEIQFGENTIFRFINSSKSLINTAPKLTKTTNNLLVSIAYPQLLSKGRSSKFLINFYIKKLESIVKERVDNSMSDYQKEGIKIQNEIFKVPKLDLGNKLQVKLSSPDIDFSDEKTFSFNEIPFSLIFLGKPKESCRPDKHLILLTVSQDGVEILSETCQVKIVDYVFDHISRPFLAQVGSVVIGISSLITYLLTLLEKADTAFGLTAGTAGLFIAGYIYSGFYLQYLQIKNKKIP